MFHIHLRGLPLQKKTIKNYQENHYLKLLKNSNYSPMLNWRTIERKCWNKTTSEQFTYSFFYKELFSSLSIVNYIHMVLFQQSANSNFSEGDPELGYALNYATQNFNCRNNWNLEFCSASQRSINLALDPSSFINNIRAELIVTRSNLRSDSSLNKKLDLSSNLRSNSRLNLRSNLRSGLILN